MIQQDLTQGFGSQAQSEKQDPMAYYRHNSDAESLAKATTLINSGGEGDVVTGADLLIRYLKRLERNYERIHSDDGSFGIDRRGWRVFGETELLLKAADRLIAHGGYLKEATDICDYIIHHGSPTRENYIQCFTHLVQMSSQWPTLKDRVEAFSETSRTIARTIGYPLKGEFAVAAEALNRKAIEEFSRNVEKEPRDYVRTGWYNWAARHDNTTASSSGIKFRDDNPRMTEAGRAGLERESEKEEAIRQKPLSFGLAKVLSRAETLASFSTASFTTEEAVSFGSYFGSYVDKIEQDIRISGIPLERLTDIYACIDNALLSQASERQRTLADYTKAVRQFQNPLEQASIHLFIINHIRKKGGYKWTKISDTKSEGENRELVRLATAELFRAVESTPIAERIKTYIAAATEWPWALKGKSLYRHSELVYPLVRLSMRNAYRDVNSLSSLPDKITGLFALAQLVNSHGNWYSRSWKNARGLAGEFVGAVEQLPEVPSRIKWYEDASKAKGYLIAFGAELHNELRDAAQKKLGEYEDMRGGKGVASAPVSHTP